MRGDFAKERVSLRVGISEVLILDFLLPGMMYRARKCSKAHVEAAANVSLASGTN